jgi:threonine aldolase
MYKELEKTLYMKMSRNAIRLADRLRKVLIDKKVDFLVENTTNQIFPILSDSILEELSKKYVYEYQERIDESHSAIRFCTSWATSDEIIDELCDELEKLL